MAAFSDYHNNRYVTQVNFDNLQYASGYAKTKKETKKERVTRISKELMFASWKTYNDKTETIKEIKQICKPHHRVNFIRRNL